MSCAVCQTGGVPSLPAACASGGTPVPVSVRTIGVDLRGVESSAGLALLGEAAPGGGGGGGGFGPHPPCALQPQVGQPPSVPALLVASVAVDGFGIPRPPALFFLLLRLRAEADGSAVAVGASSELLPLFDDPSFFPEGGFDCVLGFGVNEPFFVVGFSVLVCFV